MDDALNDLDDGPYRLWSVMNTRVAHDHAEGRVTAAMLRSIKRAIGHANVDLEAALVASGHWHDHQTIRRCPDCKEIPPKLVDGRLKAGEFYVHGWLDDQFTHDESLLPELRAKKLRRKALSRSSEIREQIYQRDKGLCRYCGVRVNWRARRGDFRATHDHVDPDGGNELDNVVTCCGPCNVDKGDRTPQEWGRVLLEPGTTAADLAKTKPGSVPGQVGDESRTDRGLSTRARPREVGTGQVGDQIRPDPGLVPNGHGSSNGNGQNGDHR